LEIGIVRPDVVIQCRNAAGCVVPTGAGGAVTTFANGFVAQLPGTINAANPLPPGFIAVVNTPSGGASRNVRRPDLISGINPYLTVDRLTLNPAAFATPTPGTFGNVPRNFLSGPSFQQFDVIFNKRFRFSETTNLEFRTEVFNVFNHTNFDIPGSRLNLALPTVAWMLLFFLIPLGLVVVYSFATISLVTYNISFGWTLSNYRQIHDPLYFNTLTRSIFLSVSATLGCLLLGFPLAYFISRQPSRWRRSGGKRRNMSPCSLLPVSRRRRSASTAIAKA
jgi:hypothetical protein